jgi:hypothetical protein
MADTPVSDNDALGGIGSIKPDLRSVLLQGLSRTIDGLAAKKYPLGYFADPNSVDANGNLRPASAPGKPISTADAAKSALANPLVIGIAIAVAASVAIFLALRK